MEQVTTDAGTIMHPGKSSGIMVLMAGGLVAVQGLILMTQISPASFEGLGALSVETISLILFQIVMLSCILGLFSLTRLLNKDERFKKQFEFVSIALFIVGLALSVEGLVAINLNGSIISGTTSTLMISIGLMLYTLGVLSMVSYLQNNEKPSLHKSTPFIASTLFILLMLPPALLFV
jgi:hypothetical protein